jgi:hypothetical protein
VCLGDNAAERSADANYKRQLQQREVDWNSASNVWSMKLSQYDIDTDENVNAFSRQVGGIQRDFGLEGTKFLESNRALYQQLAASLPVNEGDSARRFGRSAALKGMYAEGMMQANMRRKGIAQTEMMRAAGRQLLSANQQALGERGFAPIPGVAPAKPVKRNWFERGVETVGTVASIGASFSSWGGGK